MLFMNLGPIVSLLLWEVNSTGYQRQSQLLHGLFDLCEAVQKGGLSDQEIFPLYGLVRR
jgi:hypothetical protein